MNAAMDRSGERRNLKGEAGNLPRVPVVRTNPAGILTNPTGIHPDAAGIRTVPARSRSNVASIRTAESLI
jgi:hypothetical protein